MVSSSGIGMFWDNVLFGSRMANPLYQNGIFCWQSIPLDANPGHPPFLATIIALGWTLFGKSLYVSHWMMLPFIFGLLWQISNLVNHFIKDKFYQIFTFILVIADSTLLSQLVLVTPEIIQLFFFFLALNAILNEQLYLKIIALAFLGMVSYRGMMLCGGLFLIDFFIHLVIKKRSLKQFFSFQTSIAYCIAALPAIVYLYWSLSTRGWIISHPSENWGKALAFSSIEEFVKNFGRNILVLGLQFVDFGRITVIVFVLITLIIKRTYIQWEKVLTLLIIIFFSTIVIYSTSLLIKNTMGHRYYLPSYLSIGLLACILIDQYNIKKTVYIGLLSSLLLGNCIVYPDTFAQGWDSSLAHLPYWKLRKNAIEYMDNHNIPITETASFFPNNTTIDNVDVNGDMRSFRIFSGNENYIFYSNVYNLTDSEFTTLRSTYDILETFKKGGVRIEILQKKDTGTPNTTMPLSPSFIK